MEPIGSLTDRVTMRGTGMWARVRTLSARLNHDGGASHSIIVRFRSDISAGDVFGYRGRQLEVVEAEDLDGRRSWLRCLAKEAA